MLEIASRHIITSDGLALPLRTWLPKGPPSVIVLGLHGFNDYSGAFRDIGPQFSAAGVALYAYDQRGFGGAPNAGIWAGTESLRRDAIEAASALRAKWPGAKVYLLGLSMGGAVAMTVLAEQPDAAAGAILVGPAVWGRKTMPQWMSASLDGFAHITPWWPLTGEGFRVTPTDNIAVLRQMWRDPYVLKTTRVDMLYGLFNLMDEALASAPSQRTPLLLLYGLKDDLVPKQPTLQALNALPAPVKSKGGAAPNTAAHRIAVYENGRHMLLRDKAGAKTVADIIAWLQNPSAPLPSGADTQALERLKAAPK